MSPISYSLPMASAATGLSVSHLLSEIHQDKIKARRSSTNEETGEPQGKWLILAADLIAYIESLPEG